MQLGLDIVIARILHIGAGVFWVGAAALAQFVLNPYVRKQRAQGNASASGVFTGSRWASFMAINAVITILAGLYLYYRLSNGFQGTWYLTQAGIAVLMIGALAGIFALLHGGAVLSRMQAELGRFAASIQGAPSAEQRSQLERMNKQVDLHSQISFVLVIIAVVGMAIARFV